MSTLLRSSAIMLTLIQLQNNVITHILIRHLSNATGSQIYLPLNEWGLKTTIMPVIQQRFLWISPHRRSFLVYRILHMTRYLTILRHVYFQAIGYTCIVDQDHYFPKSPNFHLMEGRLLLLKTAVPYLLVVYASYIFHRIIP